MAWQYTAAGPGMASYSPHPNVAILPGLPITIIRGKVYLPGLNKYGHGGEWYYKDVLAAFP